MSFADLEEGRGRSLPLLKNENENEDEEYEGDPCQAVVAGIFEINTALSSFQRLVNTLGTPKDTLDLRHRLHKLRLHIGELVKQTSSNLKQATHFHFQLTPTKKIADAKLAKDFHFVLKQFQYAQRLSVQRETAYSPFVPPPTTTTFHENQVDKVTSSQKQHSDHLLLFDSKRQEVVLLENELVFNETIIEEREQGIQEIQQQIGQVNEIFKDLAVLVHDQGLMIDDISSNIERSSAATSQGAVQLVKASRSQRSSSSLVCLLLVIFGIILLIVIIVVVF